jgi:hypothetical protein
MQNHCGSVKIYEPNKSGELGNKSLSHSLLIRRYLSRSPSGAAFFVRSQRVWRRKPEGMVPAMARSLFPDVHRARPPGAPIDLDVERNLLTYIEAVHTGPFQSAHVHETHPCRRRRAQ